MFQFWLPAATCTRVRTSGLMTVTPGISRWIASRVLDREGAGAVPTGPDAAAGEAAGKDQDHILAQGGDLGLDLRLGAVANADHGDDGAHADDHPEHGQEGPHFVAPQGAQGDSEGGQDASS